jgi:predicted secreted acid phosphatase
VSYAALQSHIRRILNGNREPVAVFDLDGTLYDNSWRTLRILYEFALSEYDWHPTLYESVARIRPHEMPYGVVAALESVGIHDPVLHSDAFQFWRRRFFTNEYQRFDLPMPGARELVSRLRADGAAIVYFTGRDAENMLLGTVEVLKRDGFPIGTPDTHLFLKPTFDMADNAYKSGAIAHVRRIGETLAAFDNEPGLANLFEAAFPEAMVFHLHTTWAPTPTPVELSPRVQVLRDFRELFTGS